MRTQVKVAINQGTRINLPVVIGREGKWYVASVPMLDIATQGKTLEEVKGNLVELVNLYFENPHTPKPKIENLIHSELMLSTVSVVVPKGVSNNESRATS